MKENGGSDAVLDQVRLYIVHRCQSHYIGNGDKKKAQVRKKNLFKLVQSGEKWGLPMESLENRLHSS